MNHVISFSGGKDSTALAILMLEKGEPIHSLVAFDTGWEFPQMYEHWDRFEAYTGLKIVKLHPPKPLDYYLIEHGVKRRSGEDKGKVYKFGYSWPGPRQRWCTALKRQAIVRYSKGVAGAVDCIGFAADEEHRTHQISANKAGRTLRYPLVEWGVTEADALALCKSRGFDFGGLYENFSRVSCFCCPLQSRRDMRILRKVYQELWDRLLKMDAAIPRNGGFKGYVTAADFDRRFAEEERQISLPLDLPHNSTFAPIVGQKECFRLTDHAI